MSSFGYILLGFVFGYFMSIQSPRVNQIGLFSESAYFTPYHSLQPNRNCVCGRCNVTIGSLAMANNGSSGKLQTVSLPPGISVPQTDLYMRRLWGNPSEDQPRKPRYLVTFTVGVQQKNIVDRAVEKFSENFTVMLFHYDGNASDWDEFEWSRRAIHVTGREQTKWWFAKRFLHPDVVAPYEYIFVWDEDLGVENFDAEEYVKVVERHGLEISQPAMDPASNGLTWRLTRRRRDVEIHKVSEVAYDQKLLGGGPCRSPLLPPCAAFVEMMAPVISREAWRCVWKMIQNNLVHAWGLDFNFHRCVGGDVAAYERMGVVDSQWVVHRHLCSLGLVVGVVYLGGGIARFLSPPGKLSGSGRRQSLRLRHAPLVAPPSSTQPPLPDLLNHPRLRSGIYSITPGHPLYCSNHCRIIAGFPITIFLLD